MNKVYKITSLVALFLIGLQGIGQNVTEESKKLYQAKVNKNTQLEISNKYGDIEFRTWEKDSVRIEIDIKIESKDLGNIEKAKENLSFNFTKSVSLVRCNTRWTGNALSMGYISEKIAPSYKHLIVNYTVYLPKSQELTVESRFGNVFLESFNGKFTAKIAYGDLRARDLTNVRNIEVKHGKLKINSLIDARISLFGAKYVEIKSADNLEITSSLSEIEIEKVNVLRLDSKSDEITVQEVKQCKGNTNLTDLKIWSLTGILNLQSKMGSVTVRDIKPATNDINIEASRTEVDLSFNSKTVARINTEVSDKKYISYGLSFHEISSTQGTKQSLRHTLTFGKGEVKTTVRVYSSRGYLDLSHN